MEKLKIFFISIIPLLVVSLIGLCIYNNTNEVKVKSICKNLKLIDVNIHHNQALDAIEFSKEKGIEIPDTIINFDTHSDIYVYQGIDEKGAHIYDWLNEFLAKNKNATTLYWVMPEDETKMKDFDKIFKETDVKDEDMSLFGNSKKKPEKINPKISETPLVQEFLADTQTSYMEEIVSEKDEEKLNKTRFKKVKIITCTEKTLPNFRGKNVILSIDMDYISNSGFDTLNGWKHNYTSEQIEKAITNMLTTIRKKNIQPTIITISLSPFYVPKKDEEQLAYFVEFFLEYSGKKDILQKYTRTLNNPQTKPGQKKYDGI